MYNHSNMLSDSDWTYVHKDYAAGKEGSVHVININGTNAILKQFKSTKSPDKLSKEATLQEAAFQAGVAPEVYAVDRKAKRIFMQGIEKRLVDVIRERQEPWALTADEKLQIQLLMKKLDSCGVFHNDGNALNLMCQREGGRNRIYLIDYGMSRQIDRKLLRKTDEPNIRYTLEALKRSLKHYRIKAWDNMDKK